MHRRTLLLFALFVVTAWFYSSVADHSSNPIARTHEKQVQALHEVEKSFSKGVETASENDQG